MEFRVFATWPKGELLRALEDLRLGRESALQERFDRGEENVRGLCLRHVAGFLDEEQAGVGVARGPGF